MAAAIREHDWAATPLGPVDTWPAALRTAVEMVLVSPLIATLAVGIERLFLYNDPAAAHYGNRHPAALGRPLPDAFDEYDRVAGFYDQVFAGESVHVPAQPLDPAGVGVQEIFDAYLIPVCDNTGAVIAAHMTGFAITPRIKAEAAVRDSEGRFRALVAAGAVTVYRMSPDWRVMYQLDSKGLLASTLEPIAHWADDYILPEDQPMVMAAIGEAIRTRSNFELEHRVALADGSVGWVSSRAVAMLGPDGEIVEWFGAANDITDRKRAQEDLRESEEEYRTLFESIDQGFCTIEMRFDEQGRAVDYVFLKTNRAFLAQAGFGDEHIVGKNMRAFASDHEEFWFETYGRVARTGRPERFEHEAVALDRWYNVYAFRPKAGTQDQVAVLFEDITARKRIEAERREGEERQAFLLRLSDALRPLDDPAEIQDAATRVLGEHLRANRVAYVHVTDDEYVIERDYVDGVPSMAGRFRVNSFGTDKVADYQGGRTRVVRDTEKDARNYPVATSNFAAFGVAAGIGVPLIKGGRFVATLVVHMSKSRDWSTEEVVLAEETAERTWAAIERAQAEAALRESEARLSAAFESVPAGIAVTDTAGQAVIANSLYGGFLPKGLIPSRDPERAWRWRTWDEQGRAIDPQDFPSARALRGESVVPGQEMLHTDDAGREIWTQVAAVPVHDADGRVTGVATVISHIDAKKRAETALRESEQALAADLAGASLLRNLSERLGTEEDLATIHDEILSAAIAITRSDAGTIQVYEPETRSLTLLVTRGFERGMTDSFGRIDADSETACGGALREGRRTFIDFDVDETDEACRMHVEAGYRSAQATPLLSRAGAPLGMLNTHWSASGHRPSDRELRFLDLLARQAADLIERAQAQQRLRASEERLRQFGEASQDVLWIRDAEKLQWQYLTPAFETIYGLSREDALNGNNYRSWLNLIVPEDRPHAMESISRVRGGEHVTFEFRIERPSDGAIRWMRNTDFPITDATGKAALIGGIGHDITDIKAGEEHERLLVAELQHRVRNTLGVIRSISRRTAAASQTIEDYAMNFEGRLSAFARVQAAVTRNPLLGIDLETLVADELMAFAAREGKRVKIQGPGVRLKAKAAENLALAVHELATNAVKHGALAVPQGRVKVTWELTERELAHLVLVWKESGVPGPAVSPTRRGFGSELIEKTLAYELKAEVTRDFEAGGLRCTIDLPLARVLHTNGSHLGRPAETAKQLALQV